MYSGHKHVETGPNCSHELATFLKYHMTLSFGKKLRKQSCTPNNIFSEI